MYLPKLRLGNANRPLKILIHKRKVHHRSNNDVHRPPEGSRGRVDPRSRRVVITGAGVISPLGHCIHNVFEKIVNGHSGIGTISTEKFDYNKHGIYYAGQIPEDSAIVCDSTCEPNERLKSNAMKYAEFAAMKALQDANYSAVVDKQRTGVCIGNSMVDLDFIAEAHNLVSSGKGKRVTPYFVPRVLGNMAAAIIAIQHGFQGPNHSVSTACSTGLHAIGDAYNFIQNGSAEVMLAGGTDGCITPLSMIGFSRARALSTKFKETPSKASRPFDIDRDGFVMAEGGAVLILEELHHALNRSAKIYCEVVGYGASCDADHITAGLPDGSGAILAILGALQNVQTVPEKSDELWLVNAHATSTPRGDKAELQALKKLIQLLRNDLSAWNVKIPAKGPFVTANKSNLGHMISASGSIETALACLSLHSGTVPGILNLDEPEEENECENGYQLLKKSISNENTCSKTRRLALKNSFGFGGTNASIILAEYKT